MLGFAFHPYLLMYSPRLLVHVRVAGPHSGAVSNILVRVSAYELPSLPSMSSVGAVKAQIMKAVNALRQQLQEVDQSLFEPVRAAVGPEEQLPSNLHRKSAVADTTFKIMHLVMKLEKRWQQARQYASEQQSSHGGDLMEEFRAHWNSNNCEEAVQEAERIVVRMQDAMVKLTTTASRAQNTSPSNIDAGDDIDNPAQGSQTPPKRVSAPLVPLRQDITPIQYSNSVLQPIIKFQLLNYQILAEICKRSQSFGSCIRSPCTTTTVFRPLPNSSTSRPTQGTSASTNFSPAVHGA